MTGAGDPDESAVGEGHAHSLPLPSVNSVGPKRAPRDAVRRPSCAAVRARAVAELERGDDELALGDAAHLCPDLFHDSDELVADWAQRMRGLAAVVPEV